MYTENQDEFQLKLTQICSALDFEHWPLLSILNHQSDTAWLFFSIDFIDEIVGKMVVMILMEGLNAALLFRRVITGFAGKQMPVCLLNIHDDCLSFAYNVTNA